MYNCDGFPQKPYNGTNITKDPAAGYRRPVVNLLGRRPADAINAVNV